MIIIDAWSALGFLGQGLYTLRVVIQWLSSEKARKSVAPMSFWWVSLAAALIMIVYTLPRTLSSSAGEANPLPLLVGFIITLVPYIRNLMLGYHLKRRWHVLSAVFAVAVFAFCLVIMLRADIQLNNDKWFFIGTAGSLIWFSRFLWQWFFAEKKKKSYFPLSFWYISLIGLTLILIYSICTKDLVFIFGFAFNVFPIIRNILLIHKAGVPA